MTAGGPGAQDGAGARLFVALDVPEAAGLADVVAAEPVAGLRWVSPERLHCTLVFAAQVPEEQVAPALTAAEAVLRGSAPVPVRLTGRTGRFGSGVLWAEVDGGGALVAIAAGLRDAWRAAGLEVDARAFRPHVTLARRGRARVDDAACAAVAVPAAGWVADHLRVVESRAAGSGPMRWRTLSAPELARPATDA